MDIKTELNFPTPWSRVHLQKLTGPQLVKKFPSLPPSQEPSTCPYSELYQSNPRPYPTSWRSISILSSHLSTAVWKDQSKPEANVDVSQNDNFFYGEMLAIRPNPRMDDHPLSAVRECLFNIFQLPSILDAVRPPTTWGRAMPWWQGRT